LWIILIVTSSCIIYHLLYFYTNEQGNHGSESRDISCGLEPLPIPVVSENKLQISSTKFVYITKSRVSKGFDLTTIIESADVDVPGACLKYNPACKKHVCPCGLGLGHCYYIADGCLDEAWFAMNQGNSLEFIRKCNEKCDCSETCNNRVVQCGMIHAFEVIFHLPYVLLLFLVIFSCAIE
jgi:hypothetical protein